MAPLMPQSVRRDPEFHSKGGPFSSNKTGGHRQLSATMTSEFPVSIDAMDMHQLAYADERGLKRLKAMHEEFGSWTEGKYKKMVKQHRETYDQAYEKLRKQQKQQQQQQKQQKQQRSAASRGGGLAAVDKSERRSPTSGRLTPAKGCWGQPTADVDVQGQYQLAMYLLGATPEGFGDWEKDLDSECTYFRRFICFDKIGRYRRKRLVRQQVAGAVMIQTVPFFC